MNYWLVKSEPETYSWQRFIVEGKAIWDGVRNYQARNNLKLMKLDDLVLFYHSNVGKEVVGVAKVVSEAFPDPSTTDTRWVAVELAPMFGLKKTVKFEQIKSHLQLKNVLLVKQTRLSVMPISKEDYELICKMGS